MSAPRSRRSVSARNTPNLPPSNFRWALELRNSYPGLFNIEKYLKNHTQYTHIVRSGQIWSALPPGAPVGLYSQRDENLWCPGFIEKGEWKPIPETPVGPMVLKLELVERPGADPHINPDHLRPGLLLANPHSGAVEGHAPLLDYDRTLWVPRWSRFIRRAHGQLGVVNLQGYEKYYRFWTTWGISAAHGEDLLEQVEEDLPHGRAPWGQEDLLSPASHLMAELRGLKPWRGLNLPPRIDSWPQRGEIIGIRFDPDREPIPCLVVSPEELNKGNDLVVLRCIPYKRQHDEQTTVVPLWTDFFYRNRSWSVDLTLVRGLAIFGEYSDNSASRHTPSKDDPIMNEIHARLVELYA